MSIRSIGNWNVKNLYQIRKLENVISEAKRLKTDKLGHSKIRWCERDRISKQA